MRDSLAAVVLLILVGFSPTSSRANDLNSPGAVTKSYYETLNTGNLEKIRSFYSSDFKSHLVNFPAEQRDLVEHGYPITRNHTITAVDVTQEQFKDDKAWVHVLIHYKDGTSQILSVDLINEAGAWKVLWD